MRSAVIKESLRKAGIAAVKGVWESEAGCGRMWVVTSIAQKYAGHASQAAAIAFSCQAGAQTGRYSIVVDDDIDPTNIDDVIWALSTRSDPTIDIDILRQCWSNPLDPMITDEDKEQHRLWNSRAIINACKPYDRLHTFAPVAEVSPALTKATRKNGHTCSSNVILPPVRPFGCAGGRTCMQHAHYATGGLPWQTTPP